jgi:DNA-binding PadR family transcriptional regulator
MLRIFQIRKRGTTLALAHVIMTALLDKNQTGYELARSFDTSLGFFWQASHQQIYAELRKLEQNGCLSSEAVPQQGKPNKVVYELTSEGLSTLEQWVYTNTKYRVGKDELLVKLYNLNQQNAAYIVQEITKRRDTLIAQLALYEKIRQQHYADPLNLSIKKKGVYLALKAGIDDGRLNINWCNEALQLIATI